MLQKHYLDNGITLLSEDISQIRSVSLGIWIKAGSIDEDYSINGISHFIEHLTFKGTAQRTARQIAEIFDNTGGVVNAFTSKEYTCYYAKVLDEHFPLALELLTDMIFFSLMDSQEIDRERNVILEEIKMYEDTPEEVAEDLFCSALWPDHPLGMPVIGREEVITQIKREEILAYRQKHYQNSQIIVSVCGHIDHQKVKELVEKIFTLPAGSPISRTCPPFNFNPQIVCREKDIEQIHLYLGKQGFSLQDEKKLHAVNLLNIILGGGISSRLFQEVREQKGLVYSIYSSHQTMKDTGMFYIYLALSPANLLQAMQITLNILDQIRQKGVTAEELQRAKEKDKGSLLLSLENITARMSRASKQEIYLGRQISIEESVAEIEKITLEEIAETASQLLDYHNFTAVTVGKWNNPDPLNQLLRN